jgi:hypothetical protein
LLGTEPNRRLIMGVVQGTVRGEYRLRPRVIEVRVLRATLRLPTDPPDQAAPDLVAIRAGLTPKNPGVRGRW